jgi:tRNA-dihydrouridine synthase A
MIESIDRRFAVAPMMACTDRHDRYLLRLISRRALLYTEMVTAPALVHGAPEHLLAFDPAEHPVALQLGGNDPSAMARCARLGADAGYDEINMNVGCPSDRVSSGCFGAALMAEPLTVARCVEAMKRAVDVPVTVKTRIGIDDRDGYEHLHAFVSAVAAAGCDALIVHARKAWLTGLSPKENREVPPLRYDIAARVAADFPTLPVALNGGIATVDAALGHLREFAGVMLGREPYRNPYMLAQVDGRIFGDPSPPRSRLDIVSRYLEYVEAQRGRGVALHHMTRHLIGLFHGQPGARQWRRVLSEHQARTATGPEVIAAALRAMHAASERAPLPGAARAAV